MAFGKNDNKKARDLGSSNDYKPSSNDPLKMITDSGKTFKQSESGGSWNLNGTKYTDLSDLKKSKKW